MKHNEQLLQYLWKYRLYPANSLITTDGREVEVIDPGLQNHDAGPDFFNAKVKIGGQLWAGNVEIHGSSSDWFDHRHHSDKVYNSVILHLAEKVNQEIVNEAGQTVPQCRLIVPSSFRKNVSFLIHSDSKLPCQNLLCFLPKSLLDTCFPILTSERLERKADNVFTLLERFKNSWDEVFYVMLSRNFGFGVNAEAFHRLALSLPFKHVLKHSEDIFQVESLLFGQAGFLDDPDEVDEYYVKLRNEYLFLKTKYSLKSLSGHLFKRLRVRPRSFPELRIAQMASLLHSSGRLFSVILKEDDYNGLLSHFQTEPSAYWKNHFAFGKESKTISKSIGRGSLEVIVINTVAPILFAYGKSVSDESYCERAFYFLDLTKPEKNGVVREFEKGGIMPRNASDTQAMLQLAKEYCDKRKCFYCQIGHALLSSRGRSSIAKETGGGMSNGTN